MASPIKMKKEKKVQSFNTMSLIYSGLRDASFAGIQISVSVIK